MTDETSIEARTERMRAEMAELREQFAAERKAREELETRFFNLGRDRDAQCARAKRAEKERDEWEQAWGMRGTERQRLEARAEQAEREREDTLRMWREYKTAKDTDIASADAARERAEEELAEARSIARDMGAIISDTMEALDGEPDDNMIGLARALVADLKRAEADNAALLVALREAVAGRRFELKMPHPGAALLDLADAVRQLQHRDESTLLAIFQRLMEEWKRITTMVEPERIHAALIAAGIPEEDEVSGVLGLEEHVGRALARLGVTRHALHLAMLYIGDRSAGSMETWEAAAKAAGLDPKEASSSGIIDALRGKA